MDVGADTGSWSQGQVSGCDGALLAIKADLIQNIWGVGREDVGF